MSVSIQTVEFERRDAHLSELDEGPPFTIHGVALGSNDVTVGQSGTKKLWPAEELERAADSLQGRNLVVDHDNDSSGVIGRVTKAGFKEGVGVIYEAELFDEDLAQKIDHELLEVSIRGQHVSVDEMDENDDGAKIVEDIKFDNLSIVPTGASPSNTLEMGESDELSLAELSAFTESIEPVSELQEIEPGMWVKSNGTKGITISQVQDGEIEVDIYEEQDGKWRSTEETEMVSVDALTEWDVDEEDIGPAVDDDEEEMAKHHHRAAAEMIPDFLDAQDNSEETSISAFVEWADDDNVRDAVDEFVEQEGNSMEDGVGELEGWLDEKLEDEDDEEEASRRQEGEEEPVTSDADKDEVKEQSPERYPEGDELQDLQVHSVDFSGTTDSSWEEPAMEDFDTNNLEEIADHFLVSKTGFPPDNFTDLALPVVEPNGNLNLNALQNAKARAGQVSGLSGDDLDSVETKINNLANENFEGAEFGDEEEARTHPDKRPRTIDDTGSEPNVKDEGPVDIALDMINKYLTIEGNHERDSVGDMLSWLMGSIDIPIETLDDFRVAARRFIDESPGSDSFDALKVEQFRDWLLMHGKESRGRREQDKRDRMPRGEPSSVNVLTGDDLRQSADKSEESELDDITTKVYNMTDDIEQELAELSEPVAVEQSDLEELQDKADRFEEMSETLNSLKERTDILDKVDRSSVEELADSEEPVVVESARMEQLEEEAEQVAEVYAAELAKQSKILDADDLAEKFTIEELREKYEEQIGDLAEELASSEDAEPRSGDVDEDELEDRAEDNGHDEADLSEDGRTAEDIQAELKENILGD